MNIEHGVLNVEVQAPFTSSLAIPCSSACLLTGKSDSNIKKTTKDIEQGIVNIEVKMDFY